MTKTTKAIRKKTVTFKVAVFLCLKYGIIYRRSEVRILKDLKRMFLISLAVGISAQIHIGILESDFVVSAGILFFVTLVYHYDVNPIPTGILSGIMVYILRLLIFSINNDSLDTVAFAYMFEILFYLSYSIIYYILMRKDIGENLARVFLVLMVCDFGANFIEITVRSLVNYNMSFFSSEITLMIVSIIRSSIIWLVLFIFDQYGMLLLRKEHEERYKKLLWISSKLKSEMYWIEKNMDNIEEVMTTSYALYNKINNDQDKEEWSNMALNIARDIHEVKKENALVIRGVKEITEGEISDKGISLNDIINILKETMEKEARRSGNYIKFEFETGPDFHTKKHYLLMSILRNLIMNSMDALTNEGYEKKISVRHYLKADNHLFIVEDNGPGISGKDLKSIFSPGFSTKINYDTGEINRGLGLSIVKDIVEEKLNGRVEVESTLKLGTQFKIYIPWLDLEEIDENFYSR